MAKSTIAIGALGTKLNPVMVDQWLRENQCTGPASWPSLSLQCPAQQRDMENPSVADEAPTPSTATRPEPPSQLFPLNKHQQVPS